LKSSRRFIGWTRKTLRALELNPNIVNSCISKEEEAWGDPFPGKLAMSSENLSKNNHFSDTEEHS
jgi:hypothetical protein